MSLPSNYTKLDYIESHGIEYFDTGFKPNQDTRVVMDCNLYSYSATGYIFGCRGSSSQNYANRYGILYNGSYRTDYGDGNGPSYSSSLTYGTRVTIDKNKRVCIIGSESLTNAESTFQSLYNMALFCAIEGGTPTLFTNVQLYSCKIYDNGTLVRDFIPAMNASGTIGLWDDVNSTFYTNAGTGTFDYHVNKKHKTLIDGTGYEIKSGRVLIGGTGYSIKKGRTLIGGTGYDISFTTPLGELDEGTLVKLNEDGSPVEFYVAKHDYESDLNGTGRTLLVRKDCYVSRNFDSYMCGFTSSSLYTWFNDTYYNKLEANVRTAIGTTKYKSNFVAYSGYYTKEVESAIFTLGMAELFNSNEYVDGTKLPIADVLKIAYLNGSAIDQWSRTYCTLTAGSYEVSGLGVISAAGEAQHASNASSSKGARPIFTLPSDIEFNNDFMLAD